jgi:hypothetical protein
MWKGIDGEEPGEVSCETLKHFAYWTKKFRISL